LDIILKSEFLMLFRRSLAIILFAIAIASRVSAAPAVPFIDPAGLPGPLVIVGAGKVPEDAQKAFFELAGKEKAKIVVIPTGSPEADDSKKAASSLKMWADMKPESVQILHTLDRKKADDPAFVNALAQATGVFFCGIDQSQIVSAYRGTLVEKELMKLHARGGVIGGTAAGAAILGDSIFEGGTSTAKTGEGFGFLPGYVIDQHFAAPKVEKRLEGAIAAKPVWIGLGLKEGSAIVIRGRVARVIGEKAVTVCLAKGLGRPAVAESYKAGSLLDIVQLRRAAVNRAAMDSFPPDKPAEPVVEKGTLMIVGGGGAGPEIWKRFIDLSGGPEKLIVVIPTAMEDPLEKESGEEKALRRFGAKNVKALHTRDPKEADDPKFSEMLTKAGGVWFSGGRQWRFVDAYADTLTEKRFHEVLARGGAIGGSSAGASIQSEYMPRGHPLGNTVMAVEGYEHGFGFLPGCAVDQHFFVRKRTADMTGLMKLHPQYLGIGLDEGTAIVVKGSVAEVIGKTKVAFYDTTKKPVDGKDYEEVKVGESYDLKGRKKVEKLSLVVSVKEGLHTVR
jgi:cyanophycinase